MAVAQSRNMMDLGFKDILTGALDTAIGLIVGGAIAALFVLLRRVSKKDFEALLQRVQNLETDRLKLATKEDIAQVKTDIRDSEEKTEKAIKGLKEDFSKSLDSLKSDTAMRQNDILAQLKQLHEDFVVVLKRP
jgi:hypothetical protein